MRYLINENYFILKKIIDDDLVSQNIIEANYELSDFVLTWGENNYKCYKYKYIDVNNYETNEINYYGMTDANNKNSIYNNGVIVEKYTYDKLSLSGTATIISIENKNIKDDNGVFLYEQTNGIQSLRLENSYIEELRQKKNEYLKKLYLDDVLWIDNERIFYDNLKDNGLNDTSKDSWFADVMNYWKESRNERESNKTELVNATTVEEINNINYLPNHVTSKEDLI
jgi:hypothetical protein